MSIVSRVEARDLVQHQILAALAAKQEGNPRVCFKGGTLLRACWAEQYRFSEDLDFDWASAHGASDKDSILVFLQDVAKAVGRRYGTECEVRWGSQGAVVAWASATLGRGTIKIDVNRSIQPDGLPETDHWELVDRYPGIDRSHRVFGYSLNSVATAKLDCILNHRRAKSRDYYDMRRLLESGDLDPAVFVGQHFSRQNLSFDGPPGAALMEEMFEQRLQAIERLRDDYEASRDAGLITDGPASFDELFDEWHERIAEHLDDFDLMVGQEQQSQGPLSQEAVISLLAESRVAADKQGQSRCGKLLPVVKARCTLRKGHPGDCRRDKWSSWSTGAGVSHSARRRPSFKGGASAHTRLKSVGQIGIARSLGRFARPEVAGQRIALKRPDRSLAGVLCLCWSGWARRVAVFAASVSGAVSVR